MRRAGATAPNVKHPAGLLRSYRRDLLPVMCGKPIRPRRRRRDDHRSMRYLPDRDAMVMAANDARDLTVAGDDISKEL